MKPDGPLAQNAKDMLASLGTSVETTFGKQKTGSGQEETVVKVNFEPRAATCRPLLHGPDVVRVWRVKFCPVESGGSCFYDCGIG